MVSRSFLVCVALVSVDCSRAAKSHRTPSPYGFTTVTISTHPPATEPFLCRKMETIMLGRDAVVRTGTISVAQDAHCFEVSVADAGAGTVKITIEIEFGRTPDGSLAVQEIEVTLPTAEFPHLFPVENFFPAPRALIYRITFERVITPTIPVASGETVPT